MRCLVALVALLLIPLSASAQKFDSGWRFVEIDQLADLDVAGGGVKVSNMAVTPTETPKPMQTMINYQFELALVKRVSERRDVRVELIGFRSDKSPSFVSVVVAHLSDEQPGKLTTSNHRFIGLASEMADTKTYLVRVFVP